MPSRTVLNDLSGEIGLIKPIDKETFTRRGKF